MMSAPQKKWTQEKIPISHWQGTQDLHSITAEDCTTHHAPKDVEGIAVGAVVLLDLENTIRPWEAHVQTNTTIEHSMDWFKGKSTGNHGFYHQI